MSHEVMGELSRTRESGQNVNPRGERSLILEGKWTRAKKFPLCLHHFSKTSEGPTSLFPSVARYIYDVIYRLKIQFSTIKIANVNSRSIFQVEWFVDTLILMQILFLTSFALCIVIFNSKKDSNQSGFYWSVESRNRVCFSVFASLH